MAFSKANFKRFNEITGCAPPVGAYDPKLKDKEKLAGFDKSERFKAPKDVGPAGSADLNLTYAGTPVKKLFNESVCSNPERASSGKAKPKTDFQHAQDLAKIKELEKEIRKLIQERTNQDKVLLQREDEMKKLEGRLHQAQTDKSSLQAKLASVEKQSNDIKKSNELLKSKVSTLENTSTKRNEHLQTELSTLKHQVEGKDKEINKLQNDLSVTMATQLAELQSYENVLIVLEEKVQELGNTKKDEKKRTASDKDGSVEQGTKTNTAEMLKKRIMQLLQDYDKSIKDKHTALETKYNLVIVEKEELEKSLTQFHEDLQSAMSCSKALQEYRDTLSSKNNNLKLEVKELASENWNTTDKIRHLKGEVSAFTDLLFQSDQALFEATAEKAEILEKIEVLEEEKTILNENIKIMTEKYHDLEHMIGEQENRNQSSSDKLQSQLKLTQENLQQIQQDYQDVQEKNKELISALNKEKVEVEKLIFELTEEKRSTSELNQLLETKDERITDLEIHGEVSKMESQNLIEMANKHLQDVQQLQNRVNELESKEKSLLQELQEEKEVSQQTARDHADRIFELEHKQIEVLEEKGKLLSELNVREAKYSDMECQYQSLEANFTEVKEKLEKEFVEEKEKDRKEIEKLQTDLDGLVKEKNVLQGDLGEKNDELLLLKDKVDLTQKEKQSLEGKLEEVETDYKEIIRNHLQCMDSLNTKVDSMLEEKKALAQQIEELNAANGALERKAEELEGDKKKLNQEVDDLSYNTGSLYKKVADAAEDVKTLVLKVEGLNKEKSALKKKVEEVEEDKKRLCQEVEDKSSYATELTAKLEELEKHSCAIDKKVEDMESNNKTLMLKVEESACALVSLNEKIMESEEEKTCLIREVESFSEANDSLKEKLEDLEERNKALDEQTKKLTCIEKSLNEKLEKLDCDNKSLIVEFENVNHDKISLTETVKVVEDEKIKLHQKVEELSQQNISLSATMGDMKKDMKTVIKDFEKLSSVNDSLDKQVKCLKEEKILLDKEVYQLNLTVDNLNQKLSCVEENKTTLVQRVNELSEENHSLTEKLETLEEETEPVLKHVEELKNENEALKKKLEDTDKSTLQQLEESVLRWQKLYEDLHAKVEPFMDQLDAYEAEKQALLGRNQNVEAEIEKMGKEYAKLLGHQNQKQKIHHIVKIKDENNALKKEVSSCREQITKQKRNIQKLEEKVTVLEGKKRFDPSRAFTHLKENTAPLKDGNRK